MIKRFTHTTLIAGVVALAGLAGAATALAGSTSATRSAQSASIPPCFTPDLSARIFQGSPGAGQRYATLWLTNRSHHTCHTYGYVGMLFLNRRGHGMATNVIRDHSFTPHRVVLAPGQSAGTLLHWTVVQGVGDNTGPCVTAPTRVEITPPDMYTHLVIRWHGGVVCQRGMIRVQPLVAVH